MKIRQLSPHERPSLSVPVQTYCFQPSPPTTEALIQLDTTQKYYAGNITLVAEKNGSVVAEASAIPMQQNIRGAVFRMAGIAGVAAPPLTRRHGHVRALVRELLGQMRDMGHAVSALYPFRPSFYERHGYVGLPQIRTTTFSPADLPLRKLGALPGEIACERIDTGYNKFRDFTLDLLNRRHGFSVLPDYRAVDLRDANDRWLLTARLDSRVVGAVTYRILGYGGELVADDLLVTNALGKALLLQFFARHVDQVTDITVAVTADETPELWATDLNTVTQSRTSIPTMPAPMARILSLDALRGMPVGRGLAAVEIIDDPFISGRYILDGRAGALDIVNDHTTAPIATLTSPGMAGLVYGVLDPDDVIVRGFGEMPTDAMGELAALFPRISPYLFAHF